MVIGQPVNTSANMADYNNPTEINTTPVWNDYNTSDYDPDDPNRFLLPHWQQFIFITAFIVILIVASVGNVIVIGIVLAHKRMRTVTNYFLVNLAVADCMISVLNMMFNFTFLLYQDWWFGDFFCTFSQFISPCTISVSVLTFMAIAVDRYIAIMYPLRPRLPKRHVIAIITVIWIISIALSLPNLIFADTIKNGSKTVCDLVWDTEQMKMYNYILLVVNYAFPLVTLTVTYTRVGIELWGSRAIGEETSVQYERVQSKRKVVKMMIVVVVIFGVCWLPMHTYFLIASYHPSIAYFEYIQQIYMVIFLMAMSNSMYNPIIYCWMNSRFREGFIRVFCSCPCKPCKKVRNRLRIRRTLFPTGMTTMSDKYNDRNGSVMHTMTEHVDESNSMIRRTSRNTNYSNIKRKSEDYV